jgi:predicted permease
MDWRERLRLSNCLYREVTFQAIYALKSGNVFFSGDRKREQEGPAVAQRRVLQSKLTVAVLFMLTFLASAFALRYGREFFPTTLSALYFDGTIISLVLVVLFSLVWITGLQVALPFVSSQATTALLVLPVTEEDAAWVSFLAFLRLFDAPLLTALIFFPMAVGLALSSVLAGAAVLPGVLATEVLALALSLLTAKFFSRSVSGASGGSLRSLAVRWLYLVLWTIPSLVITIFITFSVQIITALGDWELNAPLTLQAVFALFPFPFGLLAASFATPSVAGGPSNSVTIALALVYFAVVAVSVRWILRAPLALSRITIVSGARRLAGTRLIVTRPSMAILKKDLRIASRTPAYAFLLLLPLLDAFVLGLFTYLGSPAPILAQRYAFAGVTVAVLLATFFGPVFFATEVIGFSLTRTLPLSQRTLILSKTSLIALVYLMAFGVVAVLVASRVNDFPAFVLFAVIELPAVIAAAFLEIGVLLERAKRTGVPIASLYSGAWWTTLVVVPGLVVSVAPLVLYTYFTLPYLPALVWMALLSLSLAAVVGGIVLRGKNIPV